MTPEQAHGFAARYRRIWRGGPSTDELTRLFATLDAVQLDAALDRLARDQDFAPTLAEIVRAHDRDLTQRYGFERPEYTGEAISPAEAYALDPDLAAWRARRAH